MTNSSVSEYGTPWWSVREPGMPERTSRSPKRPKRRRTPLPSSPYQVARIAFSVVGWPMIAGVHSTVWILAISAELIRRALS